VLVVGVRRSTAAGALIRGGPTAVPPRGWIPDP